MKTLEAKIVDANHLELSQPLDGPPGQRLALQVAEERPDARAVRGQRLREREDAWCHSHPEDLHRYVGEWIVVEGEGVLVHGKDPVRLVAEARRLGVRSPYIFFVEGTEPDVVRLGL